MKLHVALNLMNLDQACSIAQEIDAFCDAFEIGPVLLAHYGIQAIKTFRTLFPEKVLICDTNIAEFEKEIVTLALKAGGDWVTVLAGANTNTIHNSCMSAHREGKMVMLDLIDAPTAGQISVDAQALGVDALLVHNTEANPYAFLDRWDMVKGNTTLPVFISTHITRSSIQKLVTLDPAGIIIGHAITEAEKPQEEARYFYDIIRQRH
jgi:3-hexulose-6-phosphate synthase